MRIVDVREITQPISSPIRNAYIDFTKMTTSLVAVITDVIRDGTPVVGYGFNSNGRYGQGGLIRERFRTRILEADPKSLLDDMRDNIDPAIAAISVVLIAIVVAVILGKTAVQALLRRRGVDRPEAPR